MKMRYFLFGLLFLVFLAGCSGEPSEIQEEVVVPEENMTEETVIPSCDDRNICTEDIFNSELGVCENKRMEYCCGDSICTERERCDTVSHRTICTQDCQKQCPAFVTVSDFECSGGCSLNEDIYEIQGSARLRLVFDNIGELGLGPITAKYKCRNSAGYLVTEDGQDTTNGVTISSYFDNDLESVTLTGYEYTKSKANYNLEFTGSAEDDIELSCVVTFIGPEFYKTEDLNIRLIS